MTAVIMLKDQHQELLTLIGKMDLANDSQKSDLLAGISRALAVHLEVEEQIFYPAVKEMTGKNFKDSFDEHIEARHLMTKLLRTDVHTIQFADLFCRFEKNILAHVQTEEHLRFPLWSAELGEAELTRLAAEMEELKSSIQREEVTKYLGGVFPGHDYFPQISSML